MNFKNLRHIVRDYFSFSKGERNGLIVLCFILLILIAFNYALNFVKDNSVTDFSKIEKAISQWENADNKNTDDKSLFRFNPNIISEDSLNFLPISQFVKGNIIKFRQSGGIFYNEESVHRIYGMDDSIFNILKDYLFFEDRKIKMTDQISDEREKFFKPDLFDPNNASKEELEDLGFTNFQIGNLVKYRENGGVFKFPEELLKIYGVDSSFFIKVKPWIKIEPNNSIVNFEKQLKVIEINSADSVSLESLPGIGPVFASRIIRFRNLLGGFYSKSQLLEVYNFKPETYDLVKEQLVVDTASIKKISLNFASYNDFIKHPYIKSSIAKKILETKNSVGPFKTIDELLIRNVLEEEEFLKIQPYLQLN